MRAKIVTHYNEENVKPLMSVALALANYFEGEILALSVVEVPFQTPLTSVSGLPEIEKSQAILRMAEGLADAEGVPCRRMLKIAHRLSQGVIQTARDEDCNFIVLGRSASPRLGSHIVRTFMDQVLREAPCHVAVVKCAMPDEIERITVAVDNDSNSRLALELLPAFADRWQAKRKILAAVYDSANVAAARDLVTTLAPGPLAGDTEIDTVAATGAAEGILGATGGHDVIVMGEAQGAGFARWLTPATPDIVAERSQHMVILVKAYQPPRQPSFITPSLDRGLRPTWR